MRNRCIASLQRHHTIYRTIICYILHISQAAHNLHTKLWWVSGDWSTEEKRWIVFYMKMDNILERRVVMDHMLNVCVCVCASVHQMGPIGLVARACGQSTYYNILPSYRYLFQSSSKQPPSLSCHSHIH